jgi:hypothetical protein
MTAVASAELRDAEARVLALQEEMTHLQEQMQGAALKVSRQ